MSVSVLRKPKFVAGGGESAWPCSLSVLYFYCKLIYKFLHVRIINPKHLEVHPKALHQDKPQLALLVDPNLCGLGFNFYKIHCLFIFLLFLSV